MHFVSRRSITILGVTFTSGGRHRRSIGCSIKRSNCRDDSFASFSCPKTERSKRMRNSRCLGQHSSPSSCTAMSLCKDQNNAIINAGVRKIKRVTKFDKVLTLRFENLYATSRYFSIPKISA